MPAEGDTMAMAAVELGLSPERAVSLAVGRDTEEQAVAVRTAVGDGRVLVVTSAVHMPRVLLWFGAAGVTAAPAPCDFISRDPGPRAVWIWVPRSERVRQTSHALREYPGFVWARLKLRLLRWAGKATALGRPPPIPPIAPSDGNASGSAEDGHDQYRWRHLPQ